MKRVVKNPIRWFLERAPLMAPLPLEGRGRADDRYRYSESPSPHPMPLLPFTPLHLTMPYDLVVATTRDGPFTMIELLCYDYKGKDIWFVLESLVSGEQFVALPDEPIAALLARKIAAPMNIQCYSAGLRVEKMVNKEGLIVNYSRRRLLEIDLRYPSANLSPEYCGDIYCAFRFRSTEQVSTTKGLNILQKNQRNRPTMNHSSQSGLTILDIPSQSKLFSVRAEFPNQNRQVQRILGVPVVACIKQVLSGFGALTHVGVLNHSAWIRKTTAKSAKGKEHLVYTWPIEHEEEHVFRLTFWRSKPLHDKDTREILELESIECLDVARGQLISRFSFSKRLPDLRYVLGPRHFQVKVMVEMNSNEGLKDDAEPKNIFYRGVLDFRITPERTRILLQSDNSVPQPGWQRKRTLMWEYIRSDGSFSTLTQCCDQP